MTVDTTGDGSVVAYDPEAMAGLGFEDIDSTDMTMPRLTINHKGGNFKNNLTGEEMPVLRAVLLGVVKQRVMWHEVVDDGDKPQCKSPDHEHGFPNQSEKALEKKRFPWSKSNFKPEHAKPREEDPSPTHPHGWSSNGFPVLPCSACIFKEWDKGDWHVPPCAEQHTYPLLYETEEGGLMPALISFQKTGIKPSRTYINVFAQSNVPMFTVVTEIGLNQFSRGTVEYCIPTFKKGEPTARENWGEFAQQYRTARQFVRQAPRKLDEDEGPEYAEGWEPSDNTNTAPVAPPIQAPTAAAPAATGTTPQATPPASPAQQSVPAASTRRPTAAVAAPTSSEPTTPAQTDTPPEGDDDLPF